jgi:phage baseplate assembly protein W
MQLECYTLPLRLDLIMQKKEHPKCSPQQSVAQQLHLVITTAFGELSFDNSFGCNIWDHDFDNLTSGHKLKEMIRQSLLQSIHQYENRLGAVRLEISVRQEELLEYTNTRRVKKRMDIIITGVLQLTNEIFTYKDSFFVGPLSY